MIRIEPLALFALIPAALNVSAAAATTTIRVPLCTGDGLVHMVTLPAGQPRLPGDERSACCTKACHSTNCRKKTLREFEPSQ
ncbi:MAG: hypothetical protein JSR28_04555 [Proteobacteria bacterium]|nr:hypothetical protein [Pseudomonadota bacterium]